MTFVDLVAEDKVHVRVRAGWRLGASRDGCSFIALGPKGVSGGYLGRYVREFEAANTLLLNAGAPLGVLRDTVLKRAARTAPPAMSTGCSGFAYGGYSSSRSSTRRESGRSSCRSGTRSSPPSPGARRTLGPGSIRLRTFVATVTSGSSSRRSAAHDSSFPTWRRSMLRSSAERSTPRVSSSRPATRTTRIAMRWSSGSFMTFCFTFVTERAGIAIRRE